ncbi:hypothetical protein B0H19DRAFT_853698, partial [Mycena capillaripes]
PTVALGGVLGCSLADFCNGHGKRDEGAARLYHILMSEATYLIWKIRNTLVINWDSGLIPESKIINKWKYNVEHQRQVNLALANKKVEALRW